MSTSREIENINIRMFGGGDNLLKILLQEEFFNKETLGEKIQFFNSNSFDFHKLRYCIFLLEKVLAVPNFIVIGDLEEFVPIWDIQKKRVYNIADYMLQLCRNYSSLIPQNNRSSNVNITSNQIEENENNLATRFRDNAKESFLKAFNEKVDEF